MSLTKVGQFLVGLCALFFSYGFIESGIEGLCLDREMEGHVGHTTGTITRTWATAHGRGKTEYDAAYNYVANNDGYHETSQRVSPNTFARLNVGDQVPVKFLLLNPGTSRIDWPAEDEWQWAKDAGSLIQGVLIIAGTLVVCWLALPRSKGSWEDAAVKMDLGGKDRRS